MKKGLQQVYSFIFFYICLLFLQLVAGADYPKIHEKTFREILKDGSHSPYMVEIPSGSFIMGCDNKTTPFQEGCNFYERPAHEVEIKKFAISIFEITVTEWSNCYKNKGCDYNPNLNSGIDPRSPVTNISWFDAKQYVRWISKQTNKKYRLPTESEWEYAARAGSKSKFPWGDTITCEDAQFNGFNIGCPSTKGYKGKIRKKPSKVGSFEPNKFGLYDVIGNACEWVEDYSSSFYRTDLNNGEANYKEGLFDEYFVKGKKTIEFYKICRGGSWTDSQNYIRVFDRHSIPENSRNKKLGFRIALEFI